MKQFDRADAERLVQTYSDLILRLAYTYLKSTHDAEDICQNIFLKLLTGGQTFDSPAHEKAWIIRATANACKDSLRAAHRRNVGLEAAAATPAPAAPDSDVLDAVMALPRNVILKHCRANTVKRSICTTTRAIPCAKSRLCSVRASLPFPHT